MADVMANVGYGYAGSNYNTPRAMNNPMTNLTNHAGE